MEMQRAMQGNNGGAAGGAGMPDMSALAAMMGGMPPPPGAGGGNGGATGAAAGAPMDFSNLLQQFQQTGFGAPGGSPFGGVPVPPTNPADRYRNQLQSLYGMGFDDEQANLAALQANHGNLNRAVDQLLMAPPPAAAPTATSSSPTPAPEPSQGDAAGDGQDNTGDDATKKSE